MARAPALKLTIEGLETLLERLQPARLYKDPVRDLLGTLRREGERLAERRAPRGFTGRLAAGIGSELRAQANPPYALITVTGVVHNGFRYAHALDASSRYHYRGRLRGKGGRPTKGWFSKVPALVRRLMRAELRRAARAIEQRFAAGRGI